MSGKGSALAEALLHRARNWATLPLRPDKTPASNLIRRTRGHYDWKPLRDKPADETEIHDWFEHDPAIDRVLHSLVEVGEQHGCSLDGDEIDEFQLLVRTKEKQPHGTERTHRTTAPEATKGAQSGVDVVVILTAGLWRCRACGVGASISVVPIDQPRASANRSRWAVNQARRRSNLAMPPVASTIWRKATSPSSRRRCRN